MFKGFNNRQLHGFPNLNFNGDISAYGFGGVSFWLDAAFGLNTQTNLGTVSRWQARVGGGVFEQATAASQPRLILNDANYNNLPSVESTDGQRIMTASNGLRINQNGVTVAIISKVNTSSNWNVIIGNQSPQIGIVDGGTNAALNGFGYIGASGLLIQGTTESTNPRIKILTNTNVIVNGVNETTGTLGQNTELFTIFRNGGTERLIGTIAEIIAFNYSMSSTDAIALSNNINQKYAIY
jgi:hypothetical protein